MSIIFSTCIIVFMILVTAMVIKTIINLNVKTEMKDKLIYLDNNGTTRIFDESLKLMEHIYKQYYGNASGLYKFGAKSKKLLEASRTKIAKMLNCELCEVFFTSGATESNNIAIRGVFTKHRDRGKHIITSSIEHPSVWETIRSLPGVEITFLPVDKYGKVDMLEVANSIRRDTILVSVIMGNNEIGVIQDIKGIAKICREKGVHFHCDMTQIIGRYIVDITALGVDSATASSHKFHGPKAAGILYLKKGTYFDSCMSGGHQEKNIRAGTENVPGIVAMCYSLHLCYEHLKRGKQQEIQEMRDWIRKEIQSKIPEAIVNGHPTDNMYNTLSLCLPSDSRKLVMMLDKKNICVNVGSACSKGKTSTVLDAIGLSPETQQGSLRISLGFLSSWEDCIVGTRYIIDYCNSLRADAAAKASRIHETS